MFMEKQQWVYTATRVINPGEQPNGEKFVESVALQMRSDGKLDVTHPNQTVTYDGEDVTYWLNRVGLDKNLNPIKPSEKTE